MNTFGKCQVFTDNIITFSIGDAVFRRILIHALILIIAFNLLSFIRETRMLADDELLSKAPHQLTSLMAETVSLTAQDKTTVIYFFAPWCKICHLSIENLQTIYLQNENIDVIAVALDYNKQEEVIEFSKQHQLTFPIVYGNDKVKADFKVSAYPSYYVLNKDNEIIGKSLGYSTELGLYLRTL